MPSLAADVVLGLVAGLAATQLTNLAQKPLRWMTPDRVRLYEQRVRPGASSSLLAGRKVARVLGFSPTRTGEAMWGMAVHLVVGAAWGPVYALLRRYARLPALAAALTSGVAMSLILDEGLVPALGLSAPNRDYPGLTRARGFAAHLVYGAAAALMAEALGRLARRRPCPSTA